MSSTKLYLTKLMQQKEKHCAEDSVLQLVLGSGGDGSAPEEGV